MLTYTCFGFSFCCFPSAVDQIQGFIYVLGKCSITNLHPWLPYLFSNKIGIKLFKQIYQMFYYKALNSCLLCLCFNIVTDIIRANYHRVFTWPQQLAFIPFNRMLFSVNSMNIYIRLYP